MTRSGSVALAIAVLAGATLLWSATDGLRAFTTEGARRLSVERQPRWVPPTHMEDQDGRPLAISAYQGRWLLVEFIYTRCPTLCTTLGLSFQRMARELKPDRLGGDVGLLSISFDPAHDDTAALRQYADRFQADGRGWRIARVADPQELRQLLDTFGIIVVPDGLGGFEHNAAIHLVDPSGRLVRIYDYGETERAVADLGPSR